MLAINVNYITICFFYCEPKVVESWPMALSSKHIFILRVPVHSHLGKHDRDFSNLQFHAADPEGSPLDWKPQIYVVPSGKLGILKGGLLHLSDVRSILGKDDIISLAVKTTEDKLQKKRTGSSNRVGPTNMDPIYYAIFFTF